MLPFFVYSGLYYTCLVVYILSHWTAWSSVRTLILKLINDLVDHVVFLGTDQMYHSLSFLWHDVPSSVYCDMPYLFMPFLTLCYF